MNRIYSRVWNESQKQWVVASELASGDSIGTMRVVDRRSVPVGPAGILALAVLLALGGMAPAFAQDAVCINPVTGLPNGDVSAPGDQVACGNEAEAGGIEAIAIGSRAQASGNSSIAIGADARAITSSAVAIGDEAQATGLTSTAVGYRTLAEGEYSVAFGSGARALGNLAYALGNNAQAREFDVAIGAGALTGSTGSTQTTSIGHNSGLESTNTAQSVFIGAAAGNHSNGQQNTYVGFSAGEGANGNRNVYSGYYSGVASNGNFNVAAGNYAHALGSGNHNVMQGTAAGALVTGDSNVAIGNHAGTFTELDADGNPLSPVPSTHSQSISIGTYARAFASDAIVVGTYGIASANGAMSIGAYSEASGERSAVVGYQSSVGGVDSHVIGNTSSIATGTSNVSVLGNNVHIDVDNAVALGSGSDVTVAGAVALGTGSIASRAAGMAGFDPVSGLPSTDTSATWLATLGAVSVGGNGETRQITNVAAGSVDTDAVNVAQLRALEQTANAGWNVTDAEGNAVNIGPNGTVTFQGDANLTVTQTGEEDDGVIEIALNRDLDVDSVTAGDTVIDTSGVAIGADVVLNSTGLVINGGPSVTTAGIDAGGMAITNVAVGVAPTDAVNVSQLEAAVAAGQTHYYSVNDNGVVGGNYDNDGATGVNAIAAGVDAEAEGDEAVAIGYGATAAGEGSLAFGAAQALSFNSLAFGAGAVASHANSIALGAGSATTVGAQASYQGAFVGNSSSTGEMNIGGRQVTGVAAGSAPTDAVNVSQLQGGVTHAITTANEYTDNQIGDVNTRIDEIDNRVSNIEGDIIDIRGDITDIQGDIVDIRGDITDLGDRVTSVEGDMANLTQTVNQFDNRITALQNGADGMFQVSQEGPIVKPNPTGTNSSAGGNGAVASGDNSLAVGNQSVASGNNSTAIGQGAVASHDNSVALGQGSATTVGAQTGYNAAYVGSSNSTGEVNMGGRTITGVAPGIAGTDAVNVSQLNAGVNHAITQANQYTDDRFNQFQSDVWLANDELRRDMNAAVASALAVKQAPWIAGKTTYYAGVAGYRDQGAIGLSLRRTADNGRWSLEGGFTQNRDGSGVYVGVSGVIGD